MFTVSVEFEIFFLANRAEPTCSRCTRQISRRCSPRLKRMSWRDELTRSDKIRLTKLRHSLLAWYEAEARALPWRSPGTSVFERICVEVLLQRTRAETVAAIYAEFFAHFPSWKSLAGSSIAELEEAFKPIGLWRRRARSMKSLAEYAAVRAGCFPDDPAELAKVPGGGPVRFQRDPALSA